MAYLGSQEFESYARTLRRVFWSDFIDNQMSAALGLPQQAQTDAKPAAAQEASHIAVYPIPAQKTFAGTSSAR